MIPGQCWLETWRRSSESQRGSWDFHKPRGGGVRQIGLCKAVWQQWLCVWTCVQHLCVTECMSKHACASLIVSEHLKCRCIWECGFWAPTSAWSKTMSPNKDTLRSPRLCLHVRFCLWLQECFILSVLLLPPGTFFSSAPVQQPNTHVRTFSPLIGSRGQRYGRLWGRLIVACTECLKTFIS